MQTVKAPFEQPISQLLGKIGYRKRTAWVTYADAGRPEVLRSYWDGGSKDQYVAYSADGRDIPLPVGGAPGFTSEPAPWVPNPGDILISYGVSCGKPATAHITIYR